MLRTVRKVRIAWALALAALLVPGLLFAQAQSRVEITVVDEKGEPVAGAKVTVTSAEIGYEKVDQTDKKGRFATIFVDGTRVYDFKIEKEGYTTLDEQVDPEAGGRTSKEFVMPAAGSGAPAGATAPPAASGGDASVNVFNEGVAALHAGDTGTAKQKFHRAMEMNAKMIEAPATLADIYSREGDTEQAIAMARRALELDATNSRALRVLYDAHRARGDEAEAAEALERLKATEGGGAEAAVRVFNEGAEAARGDDLPTARERFEQALELDPELAPAHAALARIYLLQKEYDLAIAAADQAYEIDPGQTSVLRYKYEAYRLKGDADKAKEVFAQLSEADPEGTATALYERGIAMFNAGDMEGARQALEQALEADPDQPKGHYTLGLTYVNTGDNAKAREHLQRFLELAPDDPDAAAAREMLAYLE